MNTMKNYHDLCLQFDILILACVFQAFKKESINSFELDPYYYLSAHGYRWNAMLRFTDVNSKLISDTGNY